MDASKTNDAPKKIGNAIGWVIALTIVAGIAIITLRATLHF